MPELHIKQKGGQCCVEKYTTQREPSTDKYSVQKGGQCWNCTSNKRVASAVLKSTPHRGSLVLINTAYRKEASAGTAHQTKGWPVLC